jgi:P pilus assembly chaperone PapD
MLLAATGGAHASVALSGTRLIFDGRYREATLQATNRGMHDVLIQTWLSAPQDHDDTPPAQRRPLPFAVTPHLQRLTPGGRQTLRIFYQGAGMPEGQESLLHLYVLQVPPRSEGKNRLNIAVRQRINLFYRPPGLQGDPAKAAETLRWSFEASHAGGSLLSVTNPTAYHVALESVYLAGTRVAESLLLAPGAQHRWPIPALTAAPRLRFNALSDYGGQRAYCAVLDASAAVNARLTKAYQPQESC